MVASTSADMGLVYDAIVKELAAGRQPGSQKRIAALAGVPVDRVKQSIRSMEAIGWLLTWQDGGRYTPTQYGIPGEEMVTQQATSLPNDLSRREPPPISAETASSEHDRRIAGAIRHANDDLAERQAYERIVAHNPPPVRSYKMVLQQAMAMAVHHGTIAPGQSFLGIRQSPVPPEPPPPECPSCGRIFWPRPREIMCVNCLV